MTLERALILVAVVAVLAGDLYARQVLRQGQKLPSGPPRYYLRDGSPQWICAPYGPDKAHPSWSCAPQNEVIALILKTPPDCPH